MCKLTYMKQRLIIAFSACMPTLAMAGENNSVFIDKEIFNICASIAVIGMFMGFILAVLKKILNHKIRSRLAENSVPDTVVAEFLRQESSGGKIDAAKWAFIFAGLGLAGTFIHLTLPLGVHSLAILFFCLAASFGAFFLLQYKLAKK